MSYDGIAYSQIWTFSYNLEGEVNEIHNFGRGPQTKRNLIGDSGTCIKTYFSKWIPVIKWDLIHNILHR